MDMSSETKNYGCRLLEPCGTNQNPISTAAFKAKAVPTMSILPTSIETGNDQPINLTNKGVSPKNNAEVNKKPKLIICKEAVDFRKKLDEKVAENNSGRKHACGECGKSFHQKRTLVAHRRIHTGEKPYKCPICDAAFTQATHRNGHIKTHDPNYRPFSCSLCGRCFARKYSLTMHSYIHQGIFPFKCSFCEKKFRQAADMRKHEQRHIVHFSLLCRRCHLKFPSNAALDRHVPICSRNVPSHISSE